MRCFCCAKDIVPLEGKELEETRTRIEKEDYSYGYSPAFVLEVVANAGGIPCRCTVVCWPCVLKIHPDMWESDETWASYKPAVPFDKLPIFDHEGVNRDIPETYEAFQPPIQN